MKTSDFDYQLPEELIAQTPLEKRDHSKLLILDKDNGQIEDKYFYDIASLLWENDVLVLNKTKVINARLKWQIIRQDSEWQSSKKYEIFLHKQIDDNTWDCLVYPGKKLKPGTQVELWQWLIWDITPISEAGRVVEFNVWWTEFLNIIASIGQTPLPPYIKEKLNNWDRYQTVFSEKYWSVAAPTASLHFTPELLEKLENSWVKIEKVLLHVWLGTFKWVETEDISDHSMHSEYIEIEKEVSDRLNTYKKEWKRIIAVGTTSNRVLETFSDDNWQLWHGTTDTDIFIYPGYKWKFVDSLITNFHLPKSTLIMLVSALAWQENIKKAYEHAISHKYRFFSFWDAMFIK